MGPKVFSLWSRTSVALAIAVLTASTTAAAQASTGLHAESADYVVGSQDVLLITCYDQADLTGKFAVETDGTFTYPFIGRVKAGGMTLRQVEAQLKKQLTDDGYFKNPQVSVAVEQYRSQKVFVVGEVRTPGTYSLSGAMNLVEALARAGSTLSTAGSEAIIVHGGGHVSGPTLPTQDNGKEVIRVDLTELQSGRFNQNTMLRDGDTVFVPRAEHVYVFGQVKNPGAYALQQKNTTVLQALALAGGLTDRGTTNRMRIVRLVNGEKKAVQVKLTDPVLAGDTIMIAERIF